MPVLAARKSLQVRRKAHLARAVQSAACWLKLNTRDLRQLVVYRPGCGQRYRGLLQPLASGRERRILSERRRVKGRGSRAPP